MKPIQFQVSVSLDEDAVNKFVELIRNALKPQIEDGANRFVELIRRQSKPDGECDPQRDAKLKSSREAQFASHTPPEDQGLLIDTREVTKLLKVSARTVWAMQNSGQMPKPIRIGRAVRWSYDEIKEWVTAGCPNTTDWKKLGK